MFINLSNHPSAHWSEKQCQAAKQWGEIIDYPFPQVAPDATWEDIQKKAEKIVTEVCDLAKEQPSAVMCQGEFTLTYALVRRFKEKHVTVLSACSERVTT